MRRGGLQTNISTLFVTSGDNGALCFEGIGEAGVSSEGNC